MKIKCNFLYVRAGVASFLIHPDEQELFAHDMTQYGKNDLLAIDVKKYRAIRTGAQNRFFHSVVGYVAFKLSMDATLVKEGVKEMYGYKVKALRGKLVPKPSHLCNKFEEMSALIEGCFIEAGAQGVDMRPYVLRWEQFKKERLDKKTEVLYSVSMKH